VAGHAAKHELSLPLVSTFHTLARVKAEATSNGAEEQSRAQAEAEVVACSDAILANGPEEAEELRRHYHAPSERIEVVPPGVDHAFFSPGDRGGARAALGWASSGRMSAIGGRRAARHPVLLFVGRIQPLKGLDVAVGALANLDRPDAELVVVGGPSGSDGPEELARDVDLVAELGLVRQVRFVEPQPHHRLPTWYRAADVVLVPSRSESFGLVALEAMACGTPVVATRVGGMQTVVEHGESGLLVPAGDHAALAEAIARVLSDHRLRVHLAHGARSRAERYSWQAVGDRIVELYDAVIERRRTPVEVS
jgi:D-inositol-3-phosphate glycosyltransferase